MALRACPLPPNCATRTVGEARAHPVSGGAVVTQDTHADEHNKGLRTDTIYFTKVF